MKYIYLSFILLALAFTSCRKDFSETITTTEEEPPIVLIKSSLRGMVVDEQGSPVRGALVVIGSEQISSAADGSFEFHQIKVQKSGAAVAAQAAGYFKGISYSNFTAEGSSFVEITLLSKDDAVRILSSDGGKVMAAGGLEVNIPRNGIESLNGSVFDGPVNVYAKWLDPTSENLGAIMPGALIALNEAGEQQVLESFGMVVIELESDLGEELALDPDAEMLVEMPIPAALVADAPDEIDLWFYDLDKSRWLNQGTCIKNGNYYTCIIKSTGYWNCDVMLPAICLSGQVFNSDTTPSSYLKVIVEDLTNNFIYWGFTDINGYFCGSVPQGALLRITIIDLCDNIVYVDDIGPYAIDSQLDDIYLDVVVEEYLLNVKGGVYHCQTNDITLGHLAIRYPGKIRIIPFRNSFDYPMGLKCIDFPELEITAYSSSQPFATIETVHSSFMDIDLGDQPTCEILVDYFNLTVDSYTYWASPTSFEFKNNTSTPWLILEGLSGGGKFTLELRDYQGVGQYVTNAFFDVVNTPVFEPTYPSLTAASPEITVDITDDDGIYITGIITGTARDELDIAHTIDGNFKIRKAP